MRSIVFILAAAATLALIPLSGQNLAGRRAPSWALPDAKLQTHDLLDYRGKWLFVTFMETKCPKCKALSKTLDSLMKRYPGKVEVVGIVIPPENMATVGAYVTETKIGFPILFDSSQVAITYFKATPQNAQMDTPHLFAVDPNGWLQRDWSTARSEDPTLIKEIEAMIAAPAKK